MSAARDMLSAGQAVLRSIRGLLEDIHDTLHMLRRPYYATAAEIGELFGKPMARHVVELAKAGRVRSKKLGAAVQAGRIYRVSDVYEWCESDRETMDEIREDLGPTKQR